MTQRDQVLELLQRAGSQGVHTFELRRSYIGNPSQRIADLEKLGHRITHTRERLNGDAVGTRYRLVSGGAPSASTGEQHGHALPATVAPSESTLFDAGVLHQSRSPYDVEEAA